MATSPETDEPYEIIIVQQPLHARLCGFGEKDRRPIDPPPILEIVSKDDEHLPPDQRPPLGHFVVHASLWSADGTSECNVISSPPKTTRILMGTVVATPERLKDAAGRVGDFVCFPDLSVRTEGTYTLKFGLMRIDSQLFFQKGGTIIANATSTPFTVYSAKRFPGMTESTPLSKVFRKQGMNIPIRNSIRPRKHAGAAEDGDNLKKERYASTEGVVGEETGAENE